jgi:D-3-phosphoglycerate dehydrogenase
VVIDQRDVLVVTDEVGGEAVVHLSGPDDDGVLTHALIDGRPSLWCDADGTAVTETYNRRPRHPGAMSVQTLLFDGVEPSDLDGLDDVATFTVAGEYDSDAALRADLDRFDAIVVLTREIDAELLDAAESLSLIAKRGVGVDNVDIEAATERGVLVCNTPGANARAVAEHALSLLLAVRHRVLAADRHTRAGGWNPASFETSELGGDVLGAYGAGNTGRTLARLADGIGMDVITYDPYVDADSLPAGASLVDSPAELFKRADTVSVHVPLTDETWGAVGAEELAALGLDGILINTARGGVVNEDALVSALETETIAGAGLDVYETEPPVKDHPLFEFDQVVVTPHVAGATVEANAEKYCMTAENIRRVSDGEVPETALNPGAVR